MSAENPTLEKDFSASDTAHNANGADMDRQMTADDVAKAAARFGYGPLAHVNTAEARLPAFGGEAQPGLYKPVADRKIANPAPLGLSSFALTTFVLSLINMTTLDISEPNIVVGIAFGYGGLVQLCAGMWEMACGNTFGATAFSSYGGFWLAFAITMTPGGFDIQTALEKADPNHSTDMFYDSFALFLWGWFIFTTLLLFCTLKSTVAFFLVFFFLDITFLLLGVGYMYRVDGKPNKKVVMAGGLFGLLCSFAAWYNAFAGMADNSNSFFICPVIHFPWSATGRANRGKATSDRETA